MGQNVCSLAVKFVEKIAGAKGKIKRETGKKKVESWKAREEEAVSGD